MSPACSTAMYAGCIGLRAGVRLHVGKLRIEDLLGAIARQVLHHVGVFASAIVAASRIALGVFIGEDGAGRLEHRFGDEVLAGNHLQAFVLAEGFVVNGGGNVGVGLGEGKGHAISHTSILRQDPSVSSATLHYPSALLCGFAKPHTIKPTPAMARITPYTAQCRSFCMKLRASGPQARFSPCKIQMPPITTRNAPMGPLMLFAMRTIVCPSSRWTRNRGDDFPHPTRKAELLQADDLLFRIAVLLPYFLLTF